MDVYAQVCFSYIPDQLSHFHSIWKLHFANYDDYGLDTFILLFSSLFLCIFYGEKAEFLRGVRDGCHNDPYK